MSLNLRSNTADFCQPIPTPLDAGSTRQAGRPPRVIRVTFTPYTRRIYSHNLLNGYRALKIMAFSPGCDCLICDSCSSGQDFACGFLQIPPRDGHPCRPAIGSHHQGPKRTCTSKSPISHHSCLDGAYAPRAMPGAPIKKHLEFLLSACFCYGGEGEIRTHGRINFGGFQDRCLKPLGHLSNVMPGFITHLFLIFKY